METELERCPFCLGKAILVPTSVCSGYISCIGECGMATKKFWDEPMSEPAESRKKWHEIAVEAWNRRVEDAN